MGDLNHIKNCLLQLKSFDDTGTFGQLQEGVSNMLGLTDVTIGITPFFHINDRLVFSSLHNTNSIFLKNLDTADEKEAVSEQLIKYFAEHPDALVIEEFSNEILLTYSFVKHIQQQGWKGIILYPLKNYNQKIIGVLEIVSDKNNQLCNESVKKIQPSIPLFELALNMSWATLDARIDKIIKQQFTAIQPSVEWRFTEAALSFLLRSEQETDVKMDHIIFDNVYPLYGAIDVRNSSTERNKAIQLDMLEQLNIASGIIEKAKKLTTFPILDEISFKIKKYRHSVSNIILSDEEVAINHFFKEDVVELFQHLKLITPSLEDDIARYFASVNSSVDMIYHHRKEFDESITYINKTVAKFIDREQEAAQQIFPHYFERFVTDGVDFNIYIGQSISPKIPFSDFYLKNMKIWQLSTLAKAAQLSETISKDLPMPLRTTQLILAHNYPISISFRPAERKFDVEGAYNIRYEILKKRIDKVHIKDSNERLTQPGKIAIVYNQQKEADEYVEYIEFLQNQGLLTGELETFELEDLQGVAGLKALRVGVNFKTENQNLPVAMHPLSNEYKKQ